SQGPWRNATSTVAMTVAQFERIHFASTRGSSSGTIAALSNMRLSFHTRLLWAGSKRDVNILTPCSLISGLGRMIFCTSGIIALSQAIETCFTLADGLIP